MSLFRLEEEENYNKPVIIDSFWSNNYIEYESNGDKNKTLSVEEYLNKIRPYLKDFINNFKKSDTWNIQSRIAVNFISSRNNDEERVMHSKSDNIQIMKNDKADEVIEKRFESLFNRYQIGFETSMRGCDFMYDCIRLLYHKFCKIYVKRVRLHIDSPDWIKNKKATINPINKKYNKCLRYAVTIALNHEEIFKKLTKNNIN